MTLKNPPLAILLLIPVLLHQISGANADLVVSQDLGVFVSGNTQILNGSTALGANNCDTYTAGGGVDTWGNEIVFQFTVNEPMRIDITSVALSGDPDVFILNSLETEVNPDGLTDAIGAFNLALLDNTPPESQQLGLLAPGTYYISVDSFGGVDATFTYILIATSGNFPDNVTELGVIAEENTPFSIDTIGNTIDTELALWDSLGSLISDNDDALFDFDGDEIADALDLDGDGLEDEFYQSLIEVIGLPSGTYYVSAGSYDTEWGAAFSFIGGDEGGPLTLNYGPTPNGVLVPTPASESVTRELALGGVLWYSFEVGTITPPAPSAPLRITSITRSATGEMNITFNSLANSEYAIDISDDMSQWQELSDGIIGDEDSTTYTHTSPDQAARTLFYRVRALSAAPLQ